MLSVTVPLYEGVSNLYVKVPVMLVIGVELGETMDSDGCIWLQVPIPHSIDVDCGLRQRSTTDPKDEAERSRR